MYEETIMAERIGSLQQENEDLKNKLKDARRRYRTKQLWKIVCGLTIVVTILFGLIYIIYNSIYSKVTNDCYIESEIRRVRVFVVRQTVDWGSDRILGISSNLDDAINMTKKQSCQVRVLNTEKKSN